MGKYRAVSAVEKYAEGPKPLCECHDQPKAWQTLTSVPNGGRWYCRIEHREQSKRRYDSGAMNKVRANHPCDGTRPGYWGHLARGEDACVYCRLANADYQLLRMARKDREMIAEIERRLAS